MVGGRVLLTMDICGQRFGIWKDQVPAIAEASITHHIPLSPSWVAGISIIHDKSVTLADLSVCLCRPHTAGGRARALLMAEKGEILGFLVHGDIAECVPPREAVLPIPDRLKTTVIQVCAIMESVPIPIIDIVRLYDLLLEMQWKAPAPPAFAPEITRMHADMTRVRMIDLDGETFAAFAEKPWNDSIPLDTPVALPSIPESISGICFSRGSLLCLVDLSAYLGRPARATRLIVARISGSLHAFPISSDLEDGSAKDMALMDLPPIFHTPWMNAAVIGTHGIAPLIDLAALVSSMPTEGSHPPLPDRYKPDSRFDGVFGTKDLDVVEFSLLGSRCGVPKSEVKTIMPFKPFSRIPRAPEIVIGAARLDERLLPVLDPAAVFGTRSHPTTDWRLIHIVNGDFEAFMACESVLGERRLEQAIQRRLPLVVSHHVIYGCYLDGKALNLIWNMEALTVHFGKHLVEELGPALSPAFEGVPARPSEEKPASPVAIPEAALAPGPEPRDANPSMEPAPEHARPREAEPVISPPPVLEPAPAAQINTAAPHAPGHRGAKAGKRKLFAFAAVILVLAAAISLFLFFSNAKKPTIVTEASPAVGAAPQPQLELEIPAESAVETQVYIVVEGDTLWSISQRFTGSPYNYPRIAGENRIADPDLIFPGQRIQLLKK